MKLPFKQELLESDFYKTLVEEHKIVINNSTFSAIDDCFAKGLMQGLLAYRAKQSPIHLVFGSLVHKGLELMFRDNLPLVDIINEVKADPEYSELANIEEKNKTCEKLIEALTQCFVDRKTELFFEPLFFEERDESLTEESFLVKLGTVDWNVKPTVSMNVDIYWRGKIDLIAYYQDEVWILDNKTTSQMGPTFRYNFERDNQLISYIVGIRKLLSQTDSFRVKTKNGRSFDLTKRLPVGAIVYGICPLTKEVKTQTFPIKFTVAQLAEWEEETLGQLENLLNNDLNRFLYNEVVLPKRTSCNHKYGKCPFFDLCDMPVNNRLTMLKSGFYEKYKLFEHYEK